MQLPNHLGPVMIKPNAQTQFQTKPPGQPEKSMSQHQCHNTDSTLKCPKPTKTPKTPKTPKNFRQKSAPKIPDGKKNRNQQKFQTIINYNLFFQSHIQYLLNNL